jgi:hypothetical protein
MARARAGIIRVDLATQLLEHRSRSVVRLQSQCGCLLVGVLRASSTQKHLLVGCFNPIATGRVDWH